MLLPAVLHLALCQSPPSPLAIIAPTPQSLSITLDGGSGPRTVAPQGRAWRAVDGTPGAHVLDVMDDGAPEANAAQRVHLWASSADASPWNAAVWVPAHHLLHAVQLPSAPERMDVAGTTLWAFGLPAHLRAELPVVLGAFARTLPRASTAPLVLVFLGGDGMAQLARRSPLLVLAEDAGAPGLVQRNPALWCRGLAVQWLAGVKTVDSVANATEQLVRAAREAMEPPSSSDAAFRLAEVRSAVPRALDADFRAQLVKALSDPEPTAVATAALGLCGVADEPTIRTLGRLAGTPGNARVREAAAEALGCHVDAAPDLVRRARTLGSSGHVVEAAVLRGICRVQPTHPALTNALETGAAAEVEAVVDCLETRERDATLRAAWKRVSDPNARVRTAVLRLMLRLNARESLSSLPLLHAREPDAGNRAQLDALLAAWR